MNCWMTVVCQVVLVLTLARLTSSAIDQIVNPVMPLTMNTWVENEYCAPGSWKVRQSRTLHSSVSALSSVTLWLCGIC
jgi:hypothetical protein